MSLTKQEIRTRNRLLEIRDRLGYTFKKEVTKIFRENIDDKNVQFLIKIMHDCITANDGQFLQAAFKLFYDAERHLIEYLDSKSEYLIVRIGTTIEAR